MTVAAHIPLDELTTRCELIAQKYGVHSTSTSFDTKTGVRWFAFVPGESPLFELLLPIRCKTRRECDERILNQVERYEEGLGK